MTSRDHEDKMLQLCVRVVLGQEKMLSSPEDANAVHLLAVLLNDNGLLKKVSSDYFEGHPDQKKSTQDLLSEPWMLGLSRFKNMFHQHLMFARQNSFGLNSAP